MATMRMKKSESKFGAPIGIYTGRFLGVFPFGDGTPRVGRDGKPMGPAVEWQFEITEGEQAGQHVGRITAAEPTTRNSCGALLAGLVGREVGADEDVDPDVYKGQLFQIVLGQNKENPEKTYVTQIVRVKASGSVAPPARPASPPPPPPRQQTAATAGPSLPGGEPTYWVDTGTEQTQEMSGTAIRELLKKGSPEILGVMSIDGKTGWKPPSHFGLDSPF